MNIDKESFDRIFKSQFWKKLKHSIVPIGTIPNKQKFLDNLYSEILESTYNPSPPREYIIYNKRMGACRFVPTFSRKDYCIYFLCIKLLEEEIAVNRTNGTFGGWTLGNPIRLKENQELLELEYIPNNTINPLAWINEWHSYQHIIRLYRDMAEWQCFMTLDIANFYDGINLSLLEKKIRHVIPKSKQDVVTLLFHFLQHWNRRLEGYNAKTVGIPQDEIGDCSRILANFYLQDYDAALSEICEQHDSKYVRFADDQVIYSPDTKAARSIIFEASKELAKINLNLNSGKIREYKTKEDFNVYWAFEIFDSLASSSDPKTISRGIETFFENQDKGTEFRYHSVLKKILSIDKELIHSKFHPRLTSMLLDSDFLPQINTWHFKRIRNLVNNDTVFFDTLDRLVETTSFNSYHYNLLAFYKSERKGQNLQAIEDRLNQIRVL